MKEHILHHLKKKSGYVSGEEISRSLKISRAGIWKNVKELQRQGYDIRAVPRLGYQLRACPDKLLPWELGFELGTQTVGKTIFCYDTVASTMDEAFRLGMEDAEDGTVICAETQTQGRGRRGRTWVSPKGKGIYLSVLLRPLMPLADVPKMTLLAAVALCEALNTATDVKARIKWPNDILVNGRKLAGILTELSAEVDQVRFVVVGIGVNVNTLPAHLSPTATSVRVETRNIFPRVALAQHILRSLDTWYASLKTDGFGLVFHEWKKMSATLGERIRIVDAGGAVEGEAVDLAEDGGLLVRKHSGEIVKKLSGDVEMVEG